MQDFVSALGTATLLLASIAVALAIAILILYEAGWILNLGIRLYWRCTTIGRIPRKPGGEVGRRRRRRQLLPSSGSSDGDRPHEEEGGE